MPQPSYAHGVSSTPLLGQTIGENLRATVEKHPHQEALVVGHQHYRATYAEFWEQVSRCARGLLGKGVRRGDRVGIWSPNRFEWVVVQYATARIGAILVNINPAYQAPELEFALHQAGISHLLHARGFRNSNYLEMLETVRPRCQDLLTTLCLDDQWSGLLQEGNHDGTNHDGTSRSLEQMERCLHFDDVINIQYTSGTTGFPKGAALSHHNLLNNAYFVAQALGYSEKDRVCVPVPFYHCFGMVLGNLACTSHGACIVVPDEAFSARSVLETVEKERCTSLYGVPTMFRTMLEDPHFSHFNLSTLRTGVMAGAPCPIDLMRDVVGRLHMPEVAIGYGMTETSPISTLSARDDSLSCRVSTVGRVLAHVEISVQSQGKVVSRGTPGELCTRGYSVMHGYWNNQEATRTSIDEEGWMHSGDLAVMDELGYVKIVGRLKDMIIRGGENIYPAEVEAVLHTHPLVSEAHIVGVPSRKYGEEVMAWIRTRPGSLVNETELCNYCKLRLAAYKIPKFWKFLDHFPMTVTGKVQKYKLREMAVAELGRAGEIEKTA